MRPPARSAAAAAILALAALVVAAPAARAGIVVEVHDRDARTTLPVHWRDGRGWVEGRPRHEYEIRLRNLSPHRVLAVVSVDGVNVVTGETAAPSQSGYVLEPWQSTSIEGWRKSLDRVAAFRFTRLASSYAARTGRPDDVGVIGVAVFRELERSRALASAPAARAAEERARDADAARGASAESSLGTAHGRGLESRAQWTNFERASATPDELHTLWYDSRANLIAMGVLPPDRYADRGRIPQPFPGGFVQDP